MLRNTVISDSKGDIKLFIIHIARLCEKYCKKKKNSGHLIWNVTQCSLVEGYQLFGGKHATYIFRVEKWAAQVGMEKV